MGLQFHLEVAPGSVAEFIAGGEDEMVAARYVQSPTEVMISPPGFDASALDTLLGAFDRMT